MTVDPTPPGLDEIRDLLEATRRTAESEGRVLKEATLPLVRLRDAYSRFTSSEQALAGRVLAEWLESDDENRRFDALALIDEFRVAAAVPALGWLADRLRQSRASGAPFERERIDRILAALARVEAQEAQAMPSEDLRRRVVVRSPADLTAILAMIRAAAGSGDVTQVSGHGDGETGCNLADLPLSGPWPDVIDAEFRDRAGRRYRLFVETWHGAGGEWAPLDGDD
jgi:hypothetical protein